MVIAEGRKQPSAEDRIRLPEVTAEGILWSPSHRRGGPTSDGRGEYEERPSAPPDQGRVNDENVMRAYLGESTGDRLYGWPSLPRHSSRSFNKILKQRAKDARCLSGSHGVGEILPGRRCDRTDAHWRRPCSPRMKDKG